MNRRQNEDYENGHYAGDWAVDVHVNPPKWATALGFCAEGVYVYISADKLTKDCKSITKSQVYGLPAYLEIKRAPMTSNMYMNFFRELELMDINLLAESPAVDVECYGASMSTDRQGKTLLNGRFSIKSCIGEEEIPVEINVRGSLVLSHRRDVYQTVSQSGVVPYFKTTGMVTMNPGDFTEDRMAFAGADNPLFGFFQTPALKTMEVKSKRSLLSLWKA